MRDNCDLDAFWESDVENIPTPVVHKNVRRVNPTLDFLMGVADAEVGVEEYRDPPKAKRGRGRPKKNDLFMDATAVIEKPKVIMPKAEDKPKAKRKRRRKATRVSPDEALGFLSRWVKKLLQARKMVQKYRTAVKRYQKQGRI